MKRSVVFLLLSFSSTSTIYFSHNFSGDFLFKTCLFFIFLSLVISRLPKCAMNILFHLILFPFRMVEVFFLAVSILLYFLVWVSILVVELALTAMLVFFLYATLGMYGAILSIIISLFLWMHLYGKNIVLLEWLPARLIYPFPLTADAISKFRQRSLASFQKSFGVY